MAQYYIVLALVRLVLPVGLIFSISLRPFGMSIAYLLLFLVAPCVLVPDRRTLSSIRVKFLLLNVVVSVCLLLVHVVFHCVLAAHVPYGSLLTEHPFAAEIAQNFGLVSFKKIQVLQALHYLSPELIMTSVSLVVYVGVIKLLGTFSDQPFVSESKHQTYPLIVSAGKYFCLLLLMLSSSLRPSIISGIYFIIFMSLATAWSLGRPLERGFAVVGRCIMAIMGIHMIVILLYQTTWFAEYCPSTNIFARLFGLTRLVIHSQNEFTYEVNNKHKWATDLSPLVILFTYHIFAVETRELFKPKPKKKAPLTGLEKGKSNGSLVRGVSFHRTTRRTNREKWLIAADKSMQAPSFKTQVAIRYIDSKRLRQKQDASESTPLIKTRTSPGKSPTALGWSNKSLRNILQDSTGSIVLGDDGESAKEREPTLLEEIIDAVVDFFQVLIRSSYIATTITMMAWSIMYHSWLTFVFLMWANIVWLCQDQRSFMLKTSPVLVLYAMVLLVCQYIYGMDLTESELPTNVTHVNIHQIGLGRSPDVPPCVPVIIKSLFTCMFWVTLRQRIQELRQKRQASVISDVAGPLHLSVSTAASAMEQQREEESKSRLLRVLGHFLRAACARYWIYVVAIMLFVIGITGERMTIFRIIYMFLFLAFILMFQISWYWWRRLMYVFWIVVIIYSMINLILIYVYQFDNFSKKIAEYLYINEKLQHDLGLEPYHPADLFVKLLTPTLFLIITIMQVHYFHKDFMELSAPKSRATSKDAGSALSREPGSSKHSQAGASTIKDDITQLPLESEPRLDEDMATETSISTLNQSKNKKHSSKRSHSRSRKSIKFRTWLVNNFKEYQRRATDLIDGIFMYLDLHLVKIIMIALMLLCVFNVQAMHVPIMLLVCPALLVSPYMQRYCVLVISTMISVYFMAKMVYQIDYISHSYFDVNCTHFENDTYNEDQTLNNAEWVGFYKTTRDKPLVVQLKGYIGLIAMFTFYSLVLYRQKNLRETKQTPCELLMFPNIRREHADKDLVHCLKYLCNYGYYKFGVEICLICMVGVIGSRMDVYSVLTGLWLLVFVSVSRATQARLWMPYTLFLSISISVQYLLAVGFLPQFCVQYPWSSGTEQMKHIRTWLFLPFNLQPPKAVKLIFDFFLLLFSTLQLRVFNVEKTEGESYGGGSNSEDIGQNWETVDFVNPVPDFLGFVGTWLDVIKRIVFLGMLWVTLAIMFMTGANRVNLFSMGYLIGSFIFLWQGTDFYLLPKQSILEWWSWLLRYNVTVVLIKTLLQIPGCIFSRVVQENACWVVQLLGIGCVDKFAGGSIARYFKMQADNKGVCSVPQEDIGLAWDGVCFAFLILQRRLFYSYYFYRVIDESKATTVLASRGAELIEELRLKQMRIQEDQETRILEKIKVKMERIKANQKRIQGGMKDPGHHDNGTDSPDNGAPRRPVYKTRSKARQCPPYKSPTSHQKAVRSGDYYMFEDFDDTDVRELIHEDKADSDDEAPKEMGLAKLLSTAIKTDMKHALMMRRASMPAVRTLRHSATQARAVSLETHRRGSRFSTRSAPEMTRDADADDPTAPHTTQQDNLSGLSINMPEEETWFDKIQNIIETTSAIIGSTLVSMTRQLMRYSRDYRYVSRTLTIEKKVLKEKEGFGIGLRQGSQMRWEPLPETIVTHRKLSEISVPEIRILAPSMERGLDDSPPRSPSPDTPDDDDTSEHESAFTFQSTGSKDVALLASQDDSMFKHDRSPIVHLLYALWYAVLAHTDIVCYIMVFINQIQSATILSIPLPLMVFLWGTLTIPRPTKTFWVTLIAYTEVIVLIKSMFQFEILPWNQKVIPANMPFTAPRIIGIERKSNYALYDLLLLLIIFFHRFMLKSLGLWKESTPEGELREDMNFELKPEDTQMLVEGHGDEVGKKYVKLNDETGPLHRLVDRLHHVQETITKAMQELKTTRSDPRVATLVHRRLLIEREERRRQNLLNRQTRRRNLDSREGEINRESSLEVPLSLESSLIVAGPSMPQQPSDDDHYKVNDEQEPIIAVITTMEDSYSHYPDVIWLSLKRYLRPTYRFFKRMLEPEARVTADIYAYMFLCDFFNFLIVIFGFAAFGTHQGDGGVQAYLEENKVPIPFLVMLILQFVLIVVDRALYLRKFMLGKILFQYALIIGVHIWMFFILPFITERTFNSLPPPPMWYMVKCIYLLLSAYQIRCGYPRRIIGNFLCKSYRFINMCLFRGFMAVPFVFELRTLMDWIWTDTSMTLMDWLKMEDIFANVYLLKCSRHMEDEFPQERGLKKPNVSKYLLGGGVLAVVIAIIWFPLVFFAFGNTVGESNPPTDVTVKLRIGPFLPVYQMSAQSHNIDVFSERDYAQLSNMYARDRTAQTFLSNYMYNDLAVVTLNPNSTMKWEISPPELARLEQEVNSNSSLKVKFNFVITHPSNNAQNPPTIEDSREVEIPAFTSAGRNPERKVLSNMLQNKSEPTDWLNVPLLFPKFLKVFNKGTAKPAYQLMPIMENQYIDDTRLYRNVQLRLERDKDCMYWRVREMCTKRDPLLALPKNNCDMLVFYTFNDKLFPEKLNFISGGGIIGLYTTFVFLASRVIRGYFSGIFTKIMFDDLPYVDRVLQLCLDIYLVREALEFALEEDLFAKLVFLYRSPETMIKWSRPKEEEPPPALPPSP